MHRICGLINTQSVQTWGSAVRSEHGLCAFLIFQTHLLLAKSCQTLYILKPLNSVCLAIYTCLYFLIYVSIFAIRSYDICLPFFPRKLPLKDPSTPIFSRVLTIFNHASNVNSPVSSPFSPFFPRVFRRISRIPRAPRGASPGRAGCGHGAGAAPGRAGLRGGVCLGGTFTTAG